MLVAKREQNVLMTKLWVISCILHMECVTKTYHFFLQNVPSTYASSIYDLLWFMARAFSVELHDYSVS